MKAMKINLSEEEVRSSVDLVLKNYLLEENSFFNDDSKLVGDLEFDSLDIAEVSLFVEEELGHRLTDGLFQKCETVGDVKDALVGFLKNE